MKLDYFSIISFVIVTVCIISGSYLVMTDEPKYTLCCVDDDNIEVGIKQFTVPSKSSAMHLCRENMFNPVTFYIKLGKCFTQEK